MARGFALGPAGADGESGPRTIAAVTALQRAAGLVPDGIAGPKTIAALDTADVSERKAEPEQPAWLTLASAEVGVKEEKGSANNARVIHLFADADFPETELDSVAWRAADVGAMLQRSCHKPTDSLAARSYEV